MLLLDTSVWRRHKEYRPWIRSLDRGGCPVAIADEAVHELATSAMTTTSPEEYEQVRVACVLAARHANASPPPSEWHLGLAVGLDLPSAPRPLDVCEIIGRCREQATLKAEGNRRVSIGYGQAVMLSRWPKIMRQEKELWLSSITSAVEEASPGVIAAMRRGRPERIDQVTYDRHVSEILSDRSAISKIMIHEMKNAFREQHEVDWDAPALADGIDGLLDVYVRAFAAAILDRFEGPHTAGRKRVRFEGNDAYDLAQLLYIRPGSRWVTLDTRWLGMAASAGLTEFICRPEEIGA